jgi:hypothetical protein
MNDLGGAGEVICVSVLRDGDTVCTSLYSKLTGGRQSDVEYHNIVAAYLGLAAAMDVSFIMEELENEEGQ